MPGPILTTKLYIPPPRPRLVPRPRLIERLDEGLRLGRKLTLVSAPAGFGKTTLLSEWVCSVERRVAWVSLDEGDNDPVQFLTYLIAALQTIDPGLGRELEAVVRAGQMPDSNVVSASIINSSSIRLSLTGEQVDCTTKTSFKRTFSWISI